jgi:hypothetical protein
MYHVLLLVSVRNLWQINTETQVDLAPRTVHHECDEHFVDVHVLQLISSRLASEEKGKGSLLSLSRSPSKLSISPTPRRRWQEAEGEPDLTAPAPPLDPRSAFGRPPPSRLRRVASRKSQSPHGSWLRGRFHNGTGTGVRFRGEMELRRPARSGKGQEA